MADERRDKLDALAQEFFTRARATQEEVDGTAQVIGMVLVEKLPQRGLPPLKLLALGLEVYRLIQVELDIVSSGVLDD